VEAIINIMSAWASAIT